MSTNAVYYSNLIRFTYGGIVCWCGGTFEKKGFDTYDHTDRTIAFLNDTWLSGVVLYGCRECGRIFTYSNRTVEKFIKCVGVLKNHRLNAFELESIRSK